MTKIEVQYCDTGDWVRLIVDGTIVAENHTVDDCTWRDLLKDAGIEVVKTDHPQSYFTGENTDDE